MKTFFFFWRALALVSLVLGLGLEHSRPWPRKCLSSERLSLALASDFFLCSWPWPRALCPRLHLWLVGYVMVGFRIMQPNRSQIKCPLSTARLNVVDRQFNLATLTMPSQQLLNLTSHFIHLFFKFIKIKLTK